MFRPIPISTVVFEGDFRLALLQAVSVDRLVNHAEIDRYIIVFNGQDNDRLKREFRNLLGHVLSPGLWDKVDLLTWEDLFPEIPRVGYYDQQALKLGLSARVTADYYLILDAKNHFVRPTSLTEFFVGELPVASRTAVSPYWRKYFDCSFAAVDREPVDPDRMTPSITPYVMDTEITRELVAFLKDKYEQDLPKALIHSQGTEFLLYYAFIENIWNEKYADQPPMCRTFFASWPQDPETIIRLLKEVTAKDLPLLGLHRARLPQLSEEQQDIIRGIWRTYILKPWEDPQWFLAPSPKDIFGADE